MLKIPKLARVAAMTLIGFYVVLAALIFVRPEPVTAGPQPRFGEGEALGIPYSAYYSSTTGQHQLVTGAARLKKIIVLNEGTFWTITAYDRTTAIGDDAVTPIVRINPLDFEGNAPWTVDLEDVGFTDGIRISGATTALYGSGSGVVIAGRALLIYR